MSADGARPVFSTALPTTLCRSFGAGRVEGLLAPEALRARRCGSEPLDASCAEWTALEREGSPGAAASEQHEARGADEMSAEARLSVKELKALLRERGVDASGEPSP